MSAIFVFGSNLAGRHGKGAARYAYLRCGAVYGQGVGRQGNSYAIPTKDAELQTLPLVAIKKHVQDFIAYASLHPDMTFNVTPIGCGLAGYSPRVIAPFFSRVPRNVHLPVEFMRVLP